MLFDKLNSCIEPEIHALGYELWGCELLKEQNTSFLRIYIDAEKSISVQDCVAVSRQLQTLLQVENFIEDTCSLEISSPGIHRPLFKPEHYKKFLGHRVRLKLREKIQGSRQVVGYLKSVSEKTVEIEVDGNLFSYFFSSIAKGSLAPLDLKQ